MRCFIRLTAAVALSGLVVQNAFPDDADRGSLRDVLDYAANFAREGDSTRAIVVYDMMLWAFLRSGRSDNLTRVCHELTANVPATDIEKFNRSFWHCPEALLTDWVGDLDRFRSVDPTLITGIEPIYPRHPGVDGDYVIATFDISAEGDVGNIRIEESSSHVWERSVIDALRQWKYRPALFNGQPAKRSDVTIRFNFEIE